MCAPMVDQSELAFRLLCRYVVRGEVDRLLSIVGTFLLLFFRSLLERLFVHRNGLIVVIPISNHHTFLKQ